MLRGEVRVPLGHLGGGMSHQFLESVEGDAQLDQPGSVRVAVAVDDGIGKFRHLLDSPTPHTFDLLPVGEIMVEGGRIDHACHANDISRAVSETIEFSNAVVEAIKWSKGRTDTLLVVTADHETGGLRVLKNNASF